LKEWYKFKGETKMSEDLIFASETEAMQHLADVTGKQIVIAAEEKASPSEVSEFTDAYIEAMLWSTTDDPNDIDKENLDDSYGKEDIAPEFMKAIKSDCEKFVKENYKFIKRDIGGAGHDFWLTRAGHGAGFWDGDWKEEIDGKNAGDHLTEMSKAYKEVDPYAGDDKLIYGI